MVADTIYKICAESDWTAARAAGMFEGSSDDRRDGYIHFSTAEQLPGTLVKHFARRDGLVLIAISAKALGPDLKWEPSRGGELFPHLYAPLSCSHAIWSKALVLKDGVHVLPDLEQVS